jgi:protein-L-isoaspartate(D-aspartate) O-methyltransferase
MMDYEKQLLNMLQEQIVNRGVTNPRILEAMQRVPRHLFTPLKFRPQAYDDHPIMLDEECSTISQPYMVAYMTDELDCNPKDRILEIGTGSGYQAAILSHLCHEVYTIERYKSLSQIAQQTAASLKRSNIFFRVSDGLDGWSEQAPFDKIIITAASSKPPDQLLNQLSDGGTMLVPIGSSKIQTMTKITKKKGSYKFHDLIKCVFVPLVSKTRDMTQCDDIDSKENYL